MRSGDRKQRQRQRRECRQLGHPVGQVDVHRPDRVDAVAERDRLRATRGEVLTVVVAEVHSLVGVGHCLQPHRTRRRVARVQRRGIAVEDLVALFATVVVSARGRVGGRGAGVLDLHPGVGEAVGGGERAQRLPGIGVQLTEVAGDDHRPADGVRTEERRQLGDLVVGHRTATGVDVVNVDRRPTRDVLTGIGEAARVEQIRPVGPRLPVQALDVVGGQRVQPIRDRPRPRRGRGSGPVGEDRVGDQERMVGDICLDVDDVEIGDPRTDLECVGDSRPCAIRERERRAGDVVGQHGEVPDDVGGHVDVVEHGHRRGVAVTAGQAGAQDAERRVEQSRPGMGVHAGVVADDEGEGVGAREVRVGGVGEGAGGVIDDDGAALRGAGQALGRHRVEQPVAVGVGGGEPDGGAGRSAGEVDVDLHRGGDRRGVEEDPPHLRGQQAATPPRVAVGVGVHPHLGAGEEFLNRVGRGRGATRGDRCTQNRLRCRGGGWAGTPRAVADGRGRSAHQVRQPRAPTYGRANFSDGSSRFSDGARFSDGRTGFSDGRARFGDGGGPRRRGRPVHPVRSGRPVTGLARVRSDRRGSGIAGLCRGGSKGLRSS